METFVDIIEKYYTVTLLSKEDVMDHPLYAATQAVNDDLLRCPDTLTNDTQLAPLLAYSDTPFLVLTRRPVTYPNLTVGTAAHMAQHRIALSTYNAALCPPTTIDLSQED